MSWDPDRYLRFADHRRRPGLELAARIPDIDPVSTVVDLGAGTGELTAVLVRRWPQAAVIGVDSSAEMLERAERAHPDIRWVRSDIRDWEPPDPVDVLFSNATLHWLDDHRGLFPRLIGWVRPGGVLAVQMPDNWRMPTHLVPAEILDSSDWPEIARAALPRDRLLAPVEYLDLLAGADVDMWETTYHQVLSGDDPVWTWVTGSVLRPVLAVLDGAGRRRFEAACRDGYRRAYPPRADGTVVMAFRRLFIVARR